MSTEMSSGTPGRAAARVTPPDFATLKVNRTKIAMVTAYDAPSARLADAAGVDGILVGDSAAMTVLGYDSTVHVTVDEMLVLTRAAARGTVRALLVADMPFGSFQVSDEAAVEHAVRFVKDGGAAAVKLEGAGRMVTRVEAIVGAGIPVMGHIGLTPQSATLLGGYKPQGRTADAARQLVLAAQALERAGCFAIVLEAMPEIVARRITEGLRIPTIGIGAGVSCDGQVLVWHDLLGLSTGRVPQFVKRYADIVPSMRSALEQYVSDVRASAFPDRQHTYPMPAAELERFEGVGASVDEAPTKGTAPAPRQ